LYSGGQREHFARRAKTGTWLGIFGRAVRAFGGGGSGGGGYGSEARRLLHVALSMFKTVRVWVTRLVEAYATTKTLLDAEEGEVDAEVKTGELVLEIVVVAVLLVALVIVVLLI